jgi:hypothetical protein
MHRDDHPPPVLFAQINRVAALLAAEHETELLDYPREFSGLEGRELGHKL